MHVPLLKSLSDSVSLTPFESVSLLELDELLDELLDAPLLGGTWGTNLSLSILSTRALKVGSHSARAASSR